MSELGRLVTDLQVNGVRVDPVSNPGRRGGQGHLTTVRWSLMAPPSWSPFTTMPPSAPFRLTSSGEVLSLEGPDQTCALEISTPREPAFYSLSTAEGISYRSIALLHSKDVLATTLLQTCIRFRDRSQSCQFCAIEQSIDDGALIRKTPEQVAEVAEAAVRLDGVKQLVMTTGTPNSDDRGARLMAETAAAVKRRVDLPIQGQCEPPEDPRWYQRMKDSGIDSLGMHLEVVEPAVRRRILPGKSELSLERYYEAFADAVAVFGRGEVSTYLLAGLGDSKEALLACSRRLIDIGVYPFVVPFVPISGTPLERHPSPDSSFMVDVYQGVAEMLSAGDLRSEQMSAGCAKCGACSALSLFEQLS